MRAVALAVLIVTAALAGCARAPSMADTHDAPAPSPASAPARADATSNDATPPAAARPESPPPTTIPGRTKPAPPMSKPLPPQVLPARPDLPRLDFSCRSDADCVVRSVGSCCGAKPACVSKNAKVDPAAVQADCAARGLSSVCGFEDVQSCTCDAGTCRNASSPVTK